MPNLNNNPNIRLYTRVKTYLEMASPVATEDSPGAMKQLELSYPSLTGR